VRSVPPDRRAIGTAAENAAAAFLVAQGLVILERNYRCRMGELDLIARVAPDVLVIAEVRLRSRADYGGGAASVDGRKRQRILRASRHLLMMRPALARLRARFDVLDLKPSGEGYEIEWIRGAFEG
jgi:putative endonuclease